MLDLNNIHNRLLGNLSQQIDFFLGTFHHKQIVILSYMLSAISLLCLIGHILCKAIYQKRILQQLSKKNRLGKKNIMKIIPQKPKKNISLSIFFGLLGSFVFLLLIVLSFYFMDRKYLNDTSLLPNTFAEKTAPQTNLPLLDNENYFLNSEQFKGRVTLINFWGSWCLSCRKEHPLLMKIAQDQRFDLIGINYKDSKENAKRFLNNFGNPFKVIGIDVSGHTAINWGVYGPPETFLLNKDGIIVAKHVGPLTWQIYQKKILPKIEKAIMSNDNELLH